MDYILNIILVIIGLAFCGLVVYMYLRDYEVKKPFVMGVFSVAALAAFVLAFSVTVIPTGYTGVKTTFGQIAENSVPCGINFHIPFVQHIERVNTKQQDETFEGQVWGETESRTALYYEDVTVSYRINPEKSAWIYANVSNYKKNLVSPELVASALKATSVTLSDKEATDRSIIEPAAADALQLSLDEKYGKDVVFVHKVTVSGADFENSYNEAIAKKQQAQLAYEQQQIENKKILEKAEADAEKKRIEAQATADAAVAKAKGKAEANRILNDSITDNVLKEKYLEQWDGQLPDAVLSDGTGMFDMSGFVTDGK